MMYWDVVILSPGLQVLIMIINLLFFLDFHVINNNSNAVCHDVLCNNSSSSNH